MASTSRSRVGTTVAGKYKILSLLGEGGMGAVYEAEHVVTHRRVAVKLLHATLGWSETFVERFLLEAQLATKVGHPNIIEVLDAGVDEDGACYAVLTLLKGESVAKMLDRLQKLPANEAIAITIEVLDALSAAHAAGVIHRDIKPDNVFIANGPRGDRQVKLLDFGISKVIAENDAAAPRRGLTATGAIMGTAEYMSPEQVHGERSIDGRTDLWSVGVMLYEMLTGTVPFTGKTAHMVLVAITDDPLPSPATLVPELSPGLVHVIERALEKDAARRYLTADEMIADLRVELDAVGATSSLVPARPGLLSSMAPPRRSTDDAIAPTIIADGKDLAPRRATAGAGTLAGQVKRTDEHTSEPARASTPRAAMILATLLAAAVAIGTAAFAIRSAQHPAATNAAAHITSTDANVAPPIAPAPIVQAALPVVPPVIQAPVAHEPSPAVPDVPALAPDAHHGSHSHHVVAAHATTATPSTAPAHSPAASTTHSDPAPTHNHRIGPIQGIDE